MSGRRKLVTWIFSVLGALFLVAQLLPVGAGRTNPPITGSPNWDSPETEQLVRQACFDCHSNETQWPWYSRIAPISWRVEHHVMEGRSKVNFSEFDRPQKDAHECAEEVEEGKMPLRDYAFLHPESRLSVAERETLVQGLKATFGTKRQSGTSEHDADDHDH